MTAHPLRCREGSVRVALAPADASALFTRERRWAAGWDPWSPSRPEDETQPGTVFVTAHDDVTTTWVAGAIYLTK